MGMGNACIESAPKDAPVLGLKRVGWMTHGSEHSRRQLVAKIDFNYDHFVATYGPNGDGVGQTLLPVSTPQVSRRVELIARRSRRLKRPSSRRHVLRPRIRSLCRQFYRSNDRAYNASVRTNPSDPRYADSQAGTSRSNSSVATIMGSIYGNVSQTVGTVTRTRPASPASSTTCPF